MNRQYKMISSSIRPAHRPHPKDLSLQPQSLATLSSFLSSVVDPRGILSNGGEMSRISIPQSLLKTYVEPTQKV
jgi:hypothetical protein